MAEFIEIIKKFPKFKTKKHIPLKNAIKNHPTQSKIGQNTLTQNKVFEQALTIIGDTIEDMDIEIEQKDNKIEIFELKKGLPDCKLLKR